MEALIVCIGLALVAIINRIRIVKIEKSLADLKKHLEEK
jgi:hypothetical protein